MAANTTSSDDEDAELQQIAGLGAAVNVSRDESVDPELRAMAQSAAERAAAKLADNNRGN